MNGRQINSARTRKTALASAKAARRLLAGSAAGLFAGKGRAGMLKQAAQKQLAAELAASMSELKGLWMKIGQMLSYMDFAMPEQAREALRQLQDNARPMDVSQLETVFQNEFGQRPEEVFCHWDPIPFAAASIGQVHKAELPDGRKVAVKVQYPGVATALETDLRNLGMFDSLSAILFRGQDKGAVLAELRERLIEECDYKREAQNQNDFRRLFRNRPGVRVPEVFPDYSTERILCSEFLPGASFQEFCESADQRQKNRAGALIHSVVFESIFEHRRLHCDPHPGNFLFTDNEVVFLDFGCMKYFPETLVANWLAYARAIVNGDRSEASRLVIEMGLAPRAKRYDFDYHHDMVRFLYEPWYENRAFRFTHGYVKDIWRKLVSENPNKFRTNLPKDWVFVNRLQWGLYSLLADLSCEANLHDEMMQLVFSPRCKTTHNAC